VSNAAQLDDALVLPATSPNPNNYNKDHLACPEFLPPTDARDHEDGGACGLPVNQ